MSSHASARDLREQHEDERARYRAAARERENARRDLEVERDRVRRRELACMARDEGVEDPDFPGCVF